MKANFFFWGTEPMVLHKLDKCSHWVQYPSNWRMTLKCQRQRLKLTVFVLALKSYLLPQRSWSGEGASAPLRDPHTLLLAVQTLCSVTPARHLLLCKDHAVWPSHIILCSANLPPRNLQAHHFLQCKPPPRETPTRHSLWRVVCLPFLLVSFCLSVYAEGISSGVYVHIGWSATRITTTHKALPVESRVSTAVWVMDLEAISVFLSHLPFLVNEACSKISCVSVWIILDSHYTKFEVVTFYCMAKQIAR